MKNGFCEDVTLGNCTIKDEDIVDTINTPDALTCQNICLILSDCFFFHFDKTKEDDNCVLLRESYRQDCKTIASPVVNIIAYNLHIDFSVRYVQICRY